MPSNKNRRDRIVLISGAGTGIGEALAQRFARKGYVVAGMGRNIARLNALKGRIHRDKGIFIPLQCDVRRESDVRSAVRKISRLGTMEILVNNAGVTYFKELVSTTANEFDHVMDTNVKGMFLLTKAVLPSFLRRRRGLVINILSFAAKTVYTGSSIYSASKSAGSSMMGVLREEVRGKGIKILNVYPGAVATPMWGARNRARLEHRMIHPEEIAECIVGTAALPASMMVEEIALRPQRGDLKI